VGELLLEVLEGAEALVDGLRQRAGRLAAAVRAQAVPEERVVPDLGGVVEDGAGGLLDDFLQRHVRELRPLDQLVEVGDVGLVVLAVVVLERFGRQERLEGVHGIRKRRQLVLHRELLSDPVPCTARDETSSLLDGAARQDQEESVEPLRSARCAARPDQSKQRLVACQQAWVQLFPTAAGVCRAAAVRRVGKTGRPAQVARPTAGTAGPTGSARSSRGGTTFLFWVRSCKLSTSLCGEVAMSDVLERIKAQVTENPIILYMKGTP